jgi:hypothetical protein
MSLAHYWIDGHMGDECSCGHGVRLVRNRRHPLRDLKLGIVNRISACCIAMFVLWTLIDPDIPLARRRGTSHNAYGVYVPCGLFHKRDEV